MKLSLTKYSMLVTVGNKQKVKQLAWATFQLLLGDKSDEFPAGEVGNPTSPFRYVPCSV